jgi:hypothetical protein
MLPTLSKDSTLRRWVASAVFKHDKASTARKSDGRCRNYNKKKTITLHTKARHETRVLSFAAFFLNLKCSVRERARKDTNTRPGRATDLGWQKRRADVTSTV